MARLTTGQKFTRFIRFMMSMTDEEIMRQMQMRGFDQVEAARGWALFDAAAGRNLTYDYEVRSKPSVSRLLIDEIDRWENTYFDVADATLRNDFPGVHAVLFQNLGKTSGLDVLISVGAFVRRLDELEQSGDAEATEALAALAKRSLDVEQRNVAKGLLDRATTVSPVTTTVASPSELETRRLAEAAMWKWYLDWAKIARTVVQSKRKRIVMGISHATPGEVEEDDEAELDEPMLPPTPAPSAAPAGPAGSTPSAPN